MIKKLLLAGALALTFLNESFAQTSTATAHSFFTEGDATVYHDYTNGGKGGSFVFSTSTDTIVVAATKTADVYGSIEVDLPTGTYSTYDNANPANTSGRNIQIKVKANPPLTTASGNGQLEISLKDNNTNTPGGYANSTDKLSANVDVNSDWTVINYTYPADAFVDYWSGNCPGTATTCLIDSTHIAGILLAPNNNGTYTGTIEIAYIYAGDATIDGNPNPTLGAVVIASPGVSDTIVAPGSTITLSASVINSPNPITSVSFYNGTALLGTSTSTSSPYTLTWSSIPTGNYSVTAVATDNASNTLTSGVVTVSAPTLTPINLPAPTYVGTVAHDSGFYTSQDQNAYGAPVASYSQTLTDNNNNLVVTVNKVSPYDGISFSVPATPGSVEVPAHAQKLVLSIAATSKVPVRIALQDAAGYITDQLTIDTIGPNTNIITIPLPPTAFQDFYTAPATVPAGGCTPNSPAGKVCAVDSTQIVQVQILPAPGGLYYGDITIASVYLGDTSTTSGITGVTAAAATAATSVFPNPTISGVANYNVAVSGAITATLADMTGKVVAVQNGAIGSFDVSGLNKGVYVVSFALNGAYYSSQKLVVSGN